MKSPAPGGLKAFRGFSCAGLKNRFALPRPPGIVVGGDVMTKTQEDVLRTIQENREAIRRHGVRRLGLFGSCARGEEAPESDLDFVVEFETKSFDAYMDLKALLEELLGRRVDLVLADAIKPRLRPAILEEAIYAPGLQGLPG